MSTLTQLARVTGAQQAADNVPTDRVVTDSIENANVTAPKLADDAVSARAIADDAVGAAAIADGSVDSARMNLDETTRRAIATAIGGDTTAQGNLGITAGPSAFRTENVRPGSPVRVNSPTTGGGTIVISMGDIRPAGARIAAGQSAVFSVPSQGNGGEIVIFDF